MNKSHYNLVRADRAAHGVNNTLKQSYVSKVHNREPKELAKSETWEDVKRRRAEGDPLMRGGGKIGRE